MDTPHVVYPFFCQGTFGLPHLLAAVINAAMNMDTQIRVRVPAFNSFGLYPEVALLDHRGILCLILCYTVFHSTAIFYIPTSSAQRFQFLPSLTNIRYFLFPSHLQFLWATKIAFGNLLSDCPLSSGCSNSCHSVPVGVGNWERPGPVPCLLLAPAFPPA